MSADHAPLTPPDCDLRDYPFMPLDHGRLFASTFHARASDAEWRAGVTLWCKAFQQVPCGSLPDDEIDLARLAELGRDVKTWRKISKMALHGWIRCSDGRLYHPTVCEKALEGWHGKLTQLKSSAAGNAKKHGYAFDESQMDAKILETEALLRVLNPNSKVLLKRLRKGKNSSPNALPPGEEKAPDASPDGLPLVSPNIKGKEKGNEKGYNLDSPLRVESENPEGQTDLPPLELVSPDPPAPKPDLDAEFETWWQAYPGRLMQDGKLRKAGKPAAKAHFLTARKTASLETLLAAAEAYARATDARYVVDAERWLKRKKWADEVAEIPAGVINLPAPGAPARSGWGEQARQVAELFGTGTDESPIIGEI